MTTLQQAINDVPQRLLSIPIYLKILGIVLCVCLLFSIMVFVQLRIGVADMRLQVHQDKALSLARSLARQITPSLEQGGGKELFEHVDSMIQTFPEVAYVLVLNAEGGMVSHGSRFPNEFPEDLIAAGGERCTACHASVSLESLPQPLREKLVPGADPDRQLRRYERDMVQVTEVTVNLEEGTLGQLRLGLLDVMVHRELDMLGASLVLSLIFCTAISLALALAISYVLVRPVVNLVEATRRIRAGEFSARADVFNKDEIGVLALSFNRMADGLEQYRAEVQENEAVRQSLLGRIVQAQEDERKSIARELHDQLGQSLSHTLLKLESSTADQPGAEASVAPIKEDLRGLIDEVRRLAWHQRPSILDDYGLDHALRRYVEEMSPRVPFAMDYQWVAPEEAERLPGLVEVTLYRIVQEAVTNVIRHAEAKRVSVIVLHRETEVSVIVEDDGNGFDATVVEKSDPPPLGLMGMRERAALVGATLDVSSQPGDGVTVRVRVVLGDADHDH